MANSTGFVGILIVGAFALTGCNDSNTLEVASYDVPNSVAIADLDGDGTADIVVAATRVIYGAPDPGFLSVLLQDDAIPGSFLISDEVVAGYNPSTLALGNLNGDARVDVAVANVGSGDVSVFLHDAAAPGSFLDATFVDTGGAPLDVTTGDIDGDGAVDIAVGSFESGGSAYIAYQNPAAPGQFGAPVRLAVDRPVTSVAIGDVDGDLVADLVVTVQDSDGSDGAVAVLIQDPGVPRQFAAPLEYVAGSEPLAVKIADLDDDGNADLVLVNEGPGANGQGNAGVTVLLQDPAVAGTFLAPASYAAGSRPVHLAVADLDADANLDLVVADAGGYRGAVKVLRQDPARAGIFLTASSYPGFYGPLGVAVGDLNDDGAPDIAAADGYRATVLYQQLANPGVFDAAVPVGD